MFNPNLEIGPETIRSNSQLTSSYVAANEIALDHHNYLGLYVNYTKGTETSMELKVEVSPDGTNYAQQVTESLTGSETTVTAHNYTFTASGQYALEIKNLRAKKVRVSVKGSGTVSGTCELIAYPTWS